MWEASKGEDKEKVGTAEEEKRQCSATNSMLAFFAIFFDHSFNFHLSGGARSEKVDFPFISVDEKERDGKS